MNGSMDRMCKYVPPSYSSVPYELFDSVTSQWLVFLHIYGQTCISTSFHGNSFLIRQDTTERHGRVTDYKPFSCLVDTVFKSLPKDRLFCVVW